MKNMAVLGRGMNTSRALVLASSLALLFGLGPWAPAVEAWDTSPSCGSSTFPATGQEVSYAVGTLTAGAPVYDDGAVRAGGALSYRDNGDGTITDLNTGLMWEKKEQELTSLHDWMVAFPWSDPRGSIWDWVAAVNAEGGVGFAGYNDWRIPNVRELESIVDYGTSNPAVAEAFNNGGEMLVTCTVLECSRTQPLAYWTSTTVAFFPVNAWVVNFGGGFTDFMTKSLSAFVRAVRGGCVP